VASGRSRPERRVYTIGHSTHPLATFLALLERHGVRAVVDVRRFPGSRRHPQFGRDALAAALAARGIRYAHLEALGGRRPVRSGSPNGGWDVRAFQGYADHMASAEFAADLERLEALARAALTTVMCAEAVWWRCHRRLVADALVARGWEVAHVGPDGRLISHELTPFAERRGGRLDYPPAQRRLGDHAGSGG
jgi:uncharacterized protein (DUF488 family)